MPSTPMEKSRKCEKQIVPNGLTIYRDNWKKDAYEVSAVGVLGPEKGLGPGERRRQSPSLEHLRAQRRPAQDLLASLRPACPHV